MKELTRIVTVELTSIIKTDDNLTGLKDKEEFRKDFQKAFNALFGFTDNVVVAKVQDFILDKPSEVIDDGRCEMDQDNN